MTDATATERREFGTLKQFNEIWWIRYRVDGRERWESLRTKSEREAEKKAAVIEDRIGRGEHTSADARRLTFKDLETALLTDYRKRQLRSLRRLEVALTHLRDAFGTVRALGITAERISSYEVERLDAGAARATVNYELAALRRMFRLAVKGRRLISAPSIVIHDPHNARQGFFEPDDFAAVLKELPPYLKPVMRFAYLTSWRVASEVVPLLWSHVDLREGVLWLDGDASKNYEPRDFPFASLPELAQLIKAQRAATTALERATGEIIPYVFHRDGRPIKSYRGAWEGACARAARGGSSEPLAPLVRPALVGKLVHDLRRSAIRHFDRAGIPRSIAMELSGQKTESIYERYNITNGADKRAGLAKLDAHTKAERKTRQKGTKSTKGTQRGPHLVPATAVSA